MPFTEAKRIIYEKNILDRVVCQLKFPPNLKIDKEIPSDFQNAISNIFTELEVKNETVLSTNVANNSFNFSQSQNKNYEFLSKDGNWKVNLTRTFTALSTTEYSKWEDFEEKLKVPFNALLEFYSPPYISRVGLRYIDIIKRSDLALDQADWSELVQVCTLGFKIDPEIKNEIETSETKHIITLDKPNCKARVITAIIEKDDEECFMVDTDYYSERKYEIAEVFDILDYFHLQASNLIQWLIKKPLHTAMRPKT
jgi:uncharacterized protein (TIGR04255 family)